MQTCQYFHIFTWRCRLQRCRSFLLLLTTHNSFQSLINSKSTIQEGIIIAIIYIFQFYVPIFMLLIFMKAECQVLFRDKQSRLVNHYCSSSSVVAIRAVLQPPTMVNFTAEINAYLIINPSLFLNRTIYYYHSENWSGCRKCSTCISDNSSRPMVRFRIITLKCMYMQAPSLSIAIQNALIAFSSSMPRDDCLSLG